MKLVIIDRDGVINEDSDDFIKCPEEWRPIPGSLEAIARLNREGFRVAVATNQSGLGRGLFGIDELNAIHQKMQQALARVSGHVDGIFFCPHAPSQHCRCRKPQPGLLELIGRRFHVPLTGVPAIGDSYRDLEAAWSVNARGILVKTGKGLDVLETRVLPPEVEVFENLAHAVHYLLAEAD